ncbi:S8 family peptidase [Streptomyces humi]|uniref:S8 family peptidase n=1 Tax=Streptomyces humi TaxID=1428620 RepID=UPI0006286ED3|nr:S8 family serine peptidase [Streptomyces humi]
MKKPLWITVVTAVMTVTLGAVPARAAAPAAAAATAAAGDPVDPPLYDATSSGGVARVNVVTENRTDLSAAASAGATVQSFQTLPVVTLKVDRGGLDRLAAQPGVVSVTEDVPARPSLDESVPIIGADQAYAQGLTGAGSVVAVLDTGIATHHPFLKDRVISEACFSSTDPDLGATSLCPDGTDHQEGTGSADSGTGPCATITECDHGTHVAGIIAGNGEGITGAPKRGVAPGANLVALQVFSKFDSEDYCGPGAAPCVGSFTSSQLAALEKVLQLRQSGTPVVAANLSLGAGRYASACENDARRTAIDNLLAAGVATVVAAGNSGYTDAVSAPGCVPAAITVGATTDDDQLSAFTNRGPLLDLLAPGTSIVSSVPGDGYASKSGTSMAAPHVAGALAILRQAFPNDSVANLESRLESSGKTVTYTGADTPRIDVAQALGATVQPATTGSDFNCDKKEDMAVADPEAAVGGDARAGLVRVVYGGGKGTSELNQDLASVPGDAEPNDYFGDSLATVDYNKDGCTDLVVGTSREDVGSATDAGTVDVVYGASGGLGTGKAALHLEQGTGAEAILAASSESGDRMGAAVAAGLTLDQEPYLVIGVPGEDIDGKTDAGAVFYLRGSVNRTLVQGSSGVAGTLEAGDKYGSSLAASPEYVVVGIPGEGMVATPGPNATEVVAGQVDVMSHELNDSGVPAHVGSVDEASPAVSDQAEAGDQFGASVSATQGLYYRGFPWPIRVTFIAIGVPGEDLTYGGAAKADAGRAVVVRVDKVFGITEVNSGYDQSPDDVTGAPEAGDRMGAQVALVNRDPGTVATDATLVMAVGVPGEDIGTVADAGAVHVFGLRGSPGANDRWIEAGNGTGMPGTPTAGHAVGTSLYGTRANLYIGMPYGPGAYGSLYAMPWANVTGGTAQPVTTYAPGTGGLPAAGLRFGTSAR